MANHGDQLRNPAAGPADHQHNAHRAIADEWLRHALDGIRQMHVDEDVRREVAGRIFERHDVGSRPTMNGANRTAAPSCSPTP
jgi:hypothetical protein